MSTKLTCLFIYLFLVLSKTGPTHLQVGVAEHDELGAGVYIIPFDKGQVHPSDSLQAREVRALLPVLGVLLHHLLPETGLLTASAHKETRTHMRTFKGGLKRLQICLLSNLCKRSLTVMNQGGADIPLIYPTEGKHVIQHILIVCVGIYYLTKCFQALQFRRLPELINYRNCSKKNNCFTKRKAELQQ